MNLLEIANARTVSQQIAGTQFKTVKDLVSWMGAMQAQDFGMAKWAIGARLSGATDQLVETAINQGEIIRTHLLRPTWHFVSAEDLHWMLELSAPQVRAAFRPRNEELGLTEAVISKSNAVLAGVLRGGRQLTREELVAVFVDANVPTTENRLSHLLGQAELDGIICSGAMKWGKQTYALLQERVPKTQTLTREEALAKLARIYFTSRSPATLQDFTWWSGLSAADSRSALEMVKADFIPQVVASQTYWLAGNASVPQPEVDRANLLPAYDEFLISYKDRDAVMSFVDQKKTISENGLFRPVIVINGQVRGVWKRSVKDKVMVDIEFF